MLERDTSKTQRLVSNTLDVAINVPTLEETANVTAKSHSPAIMTKAELCNTETSPTRNPLRIVHLLPAIVNGGAEKIALDLAGYQQLAGHDIHIISIAGLSSPPTWYSKKHGNWSDIRSLNWPLRYDHPTNLWGVRQRLRPLLRGLQPDIVHSHLWAADIVASLSVDSRQMQHIAHIQNQEPWKSSTRWKHAVRRSFSRTIFRHSKTHFIACSHAVKEYETRTMKWKDENIDVVANSTDLDQFRPTPKTRSTPIRIGSAGWHIHRKGHKLLIESVAKLVSEKWNIELIIPGEGPLTKDYIRLAEDLGIADRLILPGPTSDMPSFYHTIDIFCLPSIEEGLPLVVIEAMASGVCVVASALFGMEQTVEPEVTGLLFQPGNLNEFTQALRRVIADNELAIQMGKAARRKAIASYSAEAAAVQVEVIYRNLLNR